MDQQPNEAKSTPKKTSQLPKGSHASFEQNAINLNRNDRATQWKQIPAHELVHEVDRAYVSGQHLFIWDRRAKAVLEFELLGGVVHDMIPFMIDIALEKRDSQLPSLLKDGLIEL